MNKKTSWLIVIAVLFLVLLALNFLNFHLASSQTESSVSLGTARSGETLPQNMAAPFNLSYQISSSERLAEPLQQALQAELSALATVLEAEPVTDGVPARPGQPLLLVDITTDNFVWTPFYAQATLTTAVYFASDGEISWQPGGVIVLEASPLIKSEGTFRMTDRSWGIISKPAYAQHLSQELAKSIAASLPDLFTLPAGG